MCNTAIWRARSGTAMKCLSAELKAQGSDTDSLMRHYWSKHPYRVTLTQAIDFTGNVTFAILKRWAACKVLTCTCVGIHKGRVKLASPIESTTSRTEALQARWSCASSLETFTQFFFYRVLPKTCRKGHQVCLDCGCSRLQLASSSPAPRAR